MLMTCKTCTKGVYTTKKNVLNFYRCIIFKKAKNQPEGASVKEESGSEQNGAENEESESDEQNYDEENEHIIEQKPFRSN